MSMLAEPRRRQRVGPNPRGKFFTEDEDNKGRNLLQKMGWKSGDGLGVQRQGIKDPIRPKIQSDAKGLGFDIKSDAWISHTDDFNAILANLQVAHGVVKEEEPEEEGGVSATVGFGFDTQVQGSNKCRSEDNTERLGLETKSKASRSRIHYHKFVKNKDLSKIKDEDWGCIFGKDVTQHGQGVKKEIIEEMEISRPPPPLPPPINFGPLLNGNPAQNRYKLQMLKSFTKSTLLEDQLDPYRNKTEELIVQTSLEAVDIVGDTEPEEPRKKRKKSKNKEKLPEAEATKPLEVAADEDVITQGEAPREKKRKSKKKEKPVESTEPEVAAPDVEQDVEPGKKKKKSKRRRDSPSPEMVVVTEEVVVEEDSDAPLRKKKKKPKKRPASPETVVINESITSHPEPSINTAMSATPSILADDVSSTAATGNFNRRTISAEEMHSAAAVFKGSNLLQIPGYRNQSNKLL